MKSFGIKLLLSSAALLATPARADSEFLPLPESNPQIEFRRMSSAGDPNAPLMQYLAQHTVTNWLTGGSAAVATTRVRDHLDVARAADKIAVLTLYNIPHRDCGSYSAGGAEEDVYLQWVESVASALGTADTFVIVEPDALPGADCLDSETRLVRFALLESTVRILKRAPRTRVYLDVGHPYWLSVEEAVRRLQAAGINHADGFSLNVSNFVDDQANIAYGQRIREHVGKGFVIDSSRNGNGAHPAGDWCNPSGRGVGRPSTRQTGVTGVDAFLWVKVPGESDGNCGGHPPAGQFSSTLALDLMRHSPTQQSHAQTERTISDVSPTAE
jgi:endoglucanase